MAGNEPKTDIIHCIFWIITTTKKSQLGKIKTISIMKLHEIEDKTIIDRIAIFTFLICKPFIYTKFRHANSSSFQIRCDFHRRNLNYITKFPFHLVSLSN